MARCRPKRISKNNGTITPNKVVTGVVSLLCIAMGSIIFYIVIVHQYSSLWNANTLIGTFLATFFLLGGLVVATSLSSVFDVTWDADTISGPTSYLFPPFGPTRATFQYSEIEDMGIDAMQSWYVENKHGERIRWNYIYSGYSELMLHLEKVVQIMCECEQHGHQRAGYVCEHIVNASLSRKTVGFVTNSVANECGFPDAWCEACEDIIKKSEKNEIVPENEMLGEIALLCGECYLNARNDAKKTDRLHIVEQFQS